MLNLAHALLAASIALAPAAAEARTEWSKDKIFVFGSVIFDFNRQIVSDRRGGDGDTGRLEDCSTTEFYCLKSDIASIVLPRFCASVLSVGDKWKINGVETIVVGEVDHPPTHLAMPDGPLYLLQSKGNEHFAVLYKRSHGPLGIFYDPDQPIDLSWTRPRGKGVFHSIYEKEALNRSYRLPVTFDNLAPCSFTPQSPPK